MDSIAKDSKVYTPGGWATITDVKVMPSGTTVTVDSPFGSVDLGLDLVIPAMAENDRIVWGIGRLPGRFVRYDENGFAVIHLNRDSRPMTTSVDAIAPESVPPLIPTYSFYSDDSIWDHEFCAPDDHCGCMD